MKEDKEKKLQRATPTLYPPEAEFMNVQFRWGADNVYIKKQFQTTFAGGGGGRD